MKLGYILCGINKAIANGLEGKKNEGCEEMGWIKEDTYISTSATKVERLPFNEISTEEQEKFRGGKAIKSSVFATLCSRCLLNKQIKINENSHLFLVERQEPVSVMILEHPAERLSITRSKHLILPWRQHISLLRELFFFSEGPWDMQMHNRNFSGCKGVRSQK